MLENYLVYSLRYQPKIIRYILKNKQRNKCVHIIRLIIMNMKMKMKKRSHRYDLNRPRSRHRQKCSKYKRCLSMMIRICIKQHLSNIWSSIHEKVKQHWGWVGKKSVAYKKSVYLNWQKSKNVTSFSPQSPYQQVSRSKGQMIWELRVLKF